MKKGFTIVEIIISIVLIMIIGVSVSYVVVNKNKIDDVEKIVFDAAKAYIKTEYDENGVLFQNGIKLGGNGVVIPLKDLISKGYVEEKIVQTLQDEEGLDNTAYLIAAMFEDDGSICNTGSEVIGVKGNWNINDTSYICNYDIKNGNSASEACPEHLLRCRILKYSSNNLDEISDEFSSNALNFVSSSDNNYLDYNGTIYRIMRIQGDDNIRVVTGLSNSLVEAYCIGANTGSCDYLSYFSINNSVMPYKVNFMDSNVSQDFFRAGNFCATTTDSIYGETSFSYNALLNGSSGDISYCDGKLFADFSAPLSADELYLAGLRYDSSEKTVSYLNDFVNNNTYGKYGTLTLKDKRNLICINVKLTEYGEKYLTLAECSIVNYWDFKVGFSVKVLKGNALCTEGDGTKENPYKIYS